MRKKFIVLICTLAMVFAALPQNIILAESTGFDYSQAADILTKLNLLSETRITRDSLIYSLAGFLYEQPKKIGSAESIARSTGMIGASEGYLGREGISFDEAVKYAVITLGYKAKAEQMGGYPNGYKNVASDLKIISGVYAAADSVLKTNDAVRLIYQMLEVEPMVSYYKGESDVGYRVESGETLLSINRDINKVYGLMSANADTSIYSEKGTNKNEIVINDKTYVISDEDANNYLGLNVMAYVKEEKNSDAEIVYIGERNGKNKIFTLNSKDIEEVAADYSQIQYSTDSEKIQTLKLSAVPRIIYNGVYFGLYTLSDLQPDLGELRLIDNNDDGKYDVIFITAYETMVVEAINTEDLTIRNKYRFKGCIDTLDLDPEADSVKYYIYKSGASININDIKTDNVISVARSKNSEKQIVKIYVSDTSAFKGRVNGRDNSENEITIDGKIYKMSMDFLSFLTDTTKAVEIGEEYTFYVDAFGSVAYVKYLLNSDYKMMLKMYEEDEKYYVVYMDLNEDWKTAVFADKLIVDDVDKKIPAADAYEILKNNEPQVMIIKENANGEVKQINIAKVTSQHIANQFTSTGEGNYTYRSGPRSFSMTIFLEDNAKLFVIPSPLTMDRNSYYVRDAAGYFSGDTSYTITAYDLDSYSFTPLVSIKETESAIHTKVSKSMFVITEVTKRVINDEVFSIIRGNVGVYRNMTLIGDNDHIFKGYGPGDIVNLNTNNEGRVNYITRVYSLSNFVPQTTANSNLYVLSYIVAGTVKEMENGRIKIDCGTVNTLRLDPATAVQMFDSEKNKCEAKTAADLQRGDQIVCRLTWGTISEIVCLKQKRGEYNDEN